VATQVEARVTARPRRQREQEVLVWPDLVFIEFIASVLFTLSFLILSAAVNAPLLNRANPNLTPNPSKAPWYFMNLQELLLHMHPALAGVIVPLLALGALAVIPYIDRYGRGQGRWFGSVNSVRISAFSAVYASIWTAALILYDQGRHVDVITKIAQRFDSDWEWPTVLAPFHTVRSLQTEWTWSLPRPGGGDGHWDWPQDFDSIPMPLNNLDFTALPDWLEALYWYNLNLNLPAFLVEIFIPVALMVGLPALLIYILHRMRWVTTMTDVMVALFTGFVVVYWVLIIVGAAFRGAGQDLVLPWDVPRPEG
jgi:menaquinol-cytochrome c reductase cytochrome b/c subunit